MRWFSSFLLSSLHHSSVRRRTLVNLLSYAFCSFLLCLFRRFGQPFMTRVKNLAGIICARVGALHATQGKSRQSRFRYRIATTSAVIRCSKKQSSNFCSRSVRGRKSENDSKTGARRRDHFVTAAYLDQRGSSINGTLAKNELLRIVKSPPPPGIRIVSIARRSMLTVVNAMAMTPCVVSVDSSFMAVTSNSRDLPDAPRARIGRADRRIPNDDHHERS